MSKKDHMSTRAMTESFVNPKFDEDYKKPSEVVVRQMTAEERIKWNVKEVEK